MAVIEAQERHEHLVEELIADVEAYKPDVDRDLLRRAFAYAERAHEGQRRRSGEAFIRHPWGAAKILATLHLDEQTLSAALLHDVVEDTESDIADVKAEFGDEIARLVEGVTKLTRIQFASREHAEVENYRKMIVAMAQDRASSSSSSPTACTTCGRSSISAARSSCRRPRRRSRCTRRSPTGSASTPSSGSSGPLVRAAAPAQVRGDRGHGCRAAGRSRGAREEGVQVLQRELEKADVPADISGRPKHFYSIYDKMVRKGREFNEIYDLTAMRVIVERSGDDGTRDCYGALGLIHSLWKPMPGRFKDFIAMPKLNRYRALHTTVIGPEGKPLEIQIRTREMHREAEFGIAAHWVYKKGKRGKGDAEWTAWMRSLIDWQSDEADPREFMKRFARTSSPRRSTCSRPRVR